MPWSNQAVALIVLTEETAGYSGIFGYSPGPGPGNLIFSVAARAGTDPFGNSYPAGVSSSIGSFAGTTFQGTQFLINPSGAFFYDQALPPSANTLTASIVPGTGTVTDSAGNIALPGVTSYQAPPPGSSLNWTAVQMVNDSITWYSAPNETGGWGSPVAWIGGPDSTDAVGGWTLLDNSTGAVISTETLPGTGQPALAVLGSGSTSVSSPTALISNSPVNLGEIPETWHAITLDSGWSQVAGYSIPQYTWLPFGNPGNGAPAGMLALAGMASAGSLLTSSKALNSANPLPAPYRPNNTRLFRSFSGPGARGAVEINSAGVITMLANSTYPAEYCEIDAVMKIN
jgi:hypothetical protein